jgi:transcriptional regulator with XRE-family HTH domain
MDPPISVKNLKNLMVQRGLKNKDLATILGLTPQQISKIMNDGRVITPAEAKLLNFYFSGELPFHLPSDLNVCELLGFTTKEWKTIQRLAARQSSDPSAWILQQIRGYLDWDPAGKSALE